MLNLLHTSDHALKKNTVRYTLADALCHWADGGPPGWRLEPVVPSASGVGVYDVDGVGVDGADGGDGVGGDGC